MLKIPWHRDEVHKCSQVHLLTDPLFRTAQPRPARPIMAAEADEGATTIAKYKKSRLRFGLKQPVCGDSALAGGGSVAIRRVKQITPTWGRPKPPGSQHLRCRPTPHGCNPVEVMACRSYASQWGVCNHIGWGSCGAAWRAAQGIHFPVRMPILGSSMCEIRPHFSKPRAS